LVDVALTIVVVVWRCLAIASAECSELRAAGRARAHAGRGCGRLAFFERCVASIRTRNPNMWTLIGIGVAAAYLYSVAATLAPGLSRGRSRAHGRVGVVFRGGGGHRLAHAHGAAAGAARALADLRGDSARCWASRPKTARRMRDDGTEEDIELAQCTSATGCACVPARRFRCDGVVLRGGSSVGRIV
jgi:Cu+-exporting ATPase